MTHVYLEGLILLIRYKEHSVLLWHPPGFKYLLNLVIGSNQTIQPTDRPIHLEDLAAF